jgi:hypothetical protein
MKRTSLFILLIFVIGCRKYELDGTIDDKNFIGSWHYTSSGCPTQSMQSISIIIYREGYFEYDLIDYYNPCVSSSVAGEDKSQTFFYGIVNIKQNKICLEVKKALIGGRNNNIMCYDDVFLYQNSAGDYYFETSDGKIFKKR